MTGREFIGDALCILAPIFMFVGIVYAIAIIRGGEPLRYKDEE